MPAVARYHNIPAPKTTILRPVADRNALQQNSSASRFELTKACQAQRIYPLCRFKPRSNQKVSQSPSALGRGAADGAGWAERTAGADRADGADGIDAVTRGVVLAGGALLADFAGALGAAIEVARIGSELTWKKETASFRRCACTSSEAAAAAACSTNAAFCWVPRSICAMA